MKFISSILFFCVIFISECSKVPRRGREPKIRPFKLNQVKYIESAGVDLDVSTRIYGGRSAPEGKFKFMIFSIYCPGEDFKTGVFSCSGSLIKPDWVLIAAHCFAENLSPPSQSVILAGGKADLSSYVRDRLKTDYFTEIEESKHHVQERRANHIYVNDRYNVETKEHDIALIRLQKPFDIGGTIQTVPLSFDEMKSSSLCTILGWGLAENNARNYLLMYGENIAAQTVKEGCEYKKDGDFICLQKNIDIGICHGDSGSPLICSGKVYGVASHLVSYEDSPDCGKDLEEYYADVYSNSEWLQGTLIKVGDEPPGNLQTPKDDNATGSASKTLANLAIIIFSLIILR